MLPSQQCQADNGESPVWIWIEAAVLLMILINAPPEAKESNWAPLELGSLADQSVNPLTLKNIGPNRCELRISGWPIEGRNIRPWI